MKRWILAALMAGLAAAPAWAQEQQTGHALGAVDAPVVVTVFSDFGCPYCAVFAREAFGELRAEYVETGRVRWLHVPFVLGAFANSEAATAAAECAADQGRFWGMHDLLFERQTEWSQAESVWEVLAGYGRRLELEEGPFEACLRAGPRNDVARGGEMARVAQVRATPTFFVDGERLEGAIPLETFRALLDEALK